jgi:hypothetical protein
VKITRGASKVEISTTNRKITAHAGAVLLRDVHLRLKVRDRGLSEAESILGMAEALAAGATCLDDLEVARADRVQEELRGFGVPPTPDGRMSLPAGAGSRDRRTAAVPIRAGSLRSRSV